MLECTDNDLETADFPFDEGWSHMEAYRFKYHRSLLIFTVLERVYDQEVAAEAIYSLRFIQPLFLHYFLKFFFPSFKTISLQNSGWQRVGGSPKLKEKM